MSPTPAYYVVKATGKRCAEAGILVPDSVWANYPNININRRQLGSEGRQLVPGVPDSESCYIYCVNAYNSAYFNLRTLPQLNMCYCCATCTPGKSHPEASLRVDIV